MHLKETHYCERKCTHGSIIGILNTVINYSKNREVFWNKIDSRIACRLNLDNLPCYFHVIKQICVIMKKSDQGMMHIEETVGFEEAM